MSEKPATICKGLTFLPVPEFDGPAVAFGADLGAYFNRYDLPDVPRKHEEAVSLLFFKGGALPDFAPDVDRKKALLAMRAWLCSFAPAHEAKIATAAYALWLWSTPADERAAP